MREVLRAAGVVRESIVDGPGIRLTLFVQGCPHHCKGCHNPQSHDFQGGYDLEFSKIEEAVYQNPLLQGVTFSGGEPFCQPEALAELGKRFRARGLDIMTYTGYTFEELLKREEPEIRSLLEVSDYLVDGPFLLEERSLLLRFKGSRNQRILDVRRSLEKGEAVEAEI